MRHSRREAYKNSGIDSAKFPLVKCHPSQYKERSSVIRKRNNICPRPSHVLELSDTLNPTYCPTSRASWIPGQPKTIKEVIQAWRTGIKGCLPVRMFATPELRKKVIKDYSHKLWASWGQKDALLRYKMLAELVASFNLEHLPNVIESGLEVDWNEAMLRFHVAWDVEGKPLALSVVRKKEK